MGAKRRLGLALALLGCSATEAPVVAVDAAAPWCDPSVHRECIDDAHGVFVDGVNGDDSQPGTRASPVRTVAGALALGPQAIFVCATAYPERALATKFPSLMILGGMHCGTFAWTGERPSLRGVDFGGDGYLADLRIDAAVDAEHTPDAIGIVALGGRLTVERVDVAVGPGLDGADGEVDTGPPFPPVSTLSGVDAVGATPGVGGSGKCQFQNMKGGTGGAPGADGENAGYMNGTQGLHSLCVGWGYPGGDGLDGKDGVDGMAASPDGAYGDSGRGGGGGGGGDVGAGGGGGAGGCLGRPGHRGKPGGASIGIAVDHPSVVLRETHIAASDGGHGGSGNPGTAGMPGGEGGLGAGDGCKGGRGGHGGHGGAGSGARGGTSAGLLWNFATMFDRGPGSLDADAATTLSHGHAGAGGAGGKPTMPVAPAGLEGDSVIIPRPQAPAGP